jgi:hypothetical protein
VNALCVTGGLEKAMRSHDIFSVFAHKERTKATQEHPRGVHPPGPSVAIPWSSEGIGHGPIETQQSLVEEASFCSEFACRHIIMSRPFSS